MSGWTIEVVADTVTQKLANASKEIHSTILDVLESGGVEIESHAREIVPVRTGFLQSTIYHKIDPTELSLELGATADYAEFVEFGTNRMAAQPFIRPAYDAYTEKIYEALLHGILFAF